MYEVFDPRTGRTLARTRYEWVARLLTWRNGLDYD